MSELYGAFDALEEDFADAFDTPTEAQRAVDDRNLDWEATEAGQEWLDGGNEPRWSVARITDEYIADNEWTRR